MAAVITNEHTKGLAFRVDQAGTRVELRYSGCRAVTGVHGCHFNDCVTVFSFPDVLIAASKIKKGKRKCGQTKKDLVVMTFQVSPPQDDAGNEFQWIRET